MEIQLFRRCQQLSARVVDLTTDAGVGRTVAGLTLIGRGGDDIVAGLTRLETRARRTVWNMQPDQRFDPEEPTEALNERSRARGVDLQLITSQRAVDQNPLLTSNFPNVLVGPVYLRTILIDQAGAVLEGPPMPSGEGTAWLVTQSDVVAEVCSIWLETRRHSQAALSGGAPAPLTKRQYAIACRMAAGAKDAAIARELRISTRTVVTEVVPA
jgi:hypothetical protein